MLVVHLWSFEIILSLTEMKRKVYVSLRIFYSVWHAMVLGDFPFTHVHADWTKYESKDMMWSILDFAIRELKIEHDGHP